MLSVSKGQSRIPPSSEEKLLVNRSVIIIAHRLTTVERADDILVLQDGRIYEFGARHALAADRNSHYAGLLRTGILTEAT